jgi:hypothetical protein
MRKYLTLGLIIWATFASAQVDSTKVKEQAEIMARALLQNDYETFITFTYPAVIDMIGGKESMISLIKKGKEDMDLKGISIVRVIIGSPSKIVKAGKEIHCLIPQTIFLKVPGGTMKSDSYLLAISKDHVNHWFFIDTVRLTMENVTTIIPHYNEDLQLPTREPAVFIAD